MALVYAMTERNPPMFFKALSWTYCNGDLGWGAMFYGNLK